MELLLAVHEKGAVDSIVAFPFGVMKPCKGSLTGFHAKDSLNHMVLRGRKGLDVGTEAYFLAYVVFASPGAAAVVVLVCPDAVAFAFLRQRCS